MGTEIQQYPTLREEQRIAARHQARENLLNQMGGEPRFENFERRAYHRFSPEVEMVMNRGVWIMLAAAFVLSAIHIFFAASDAYGIGINSPILKTIGGVAFVVVAEIASIIFSTAPAVYEHNMPRVTKRWSYAAALVAGLIAVVFNVAVAINYTATPFDWVIQWITSIAIRPELFFVATTPPVFVLIAAQIQKARILATNERRYGAQVEHDKAMQDWREIVSQIEQHDHWREAFAHAIWDAWKKNKRRDMLAKITNEQRRAIILREMENEDILGTQMTDKGAGETDNDSQDEAKKKSTKLLAEHDSDLLELQGKERVIAYLRRYPEQKKEDVNILADMLDVSGRTVYRGLERIQKNGFHSEEN